ncbi:MAG: dUTP diphosphatase [Eggerthellaceae bacterium]|nr:dUTP diphosphatase [Eggerthellaceae bacterium]
MDGLELPVRLHAPNLKPPSHTRSGDAGLDLCAATDVVLKPFERALIPAGISMAIPKGYAGFVLPRSGLALHHGFSLVNSPGLIDSNYRGEVQVIAINLDPQETFTIRQGDRIAQLVIMRVEEPNIVLCDSLDETARGSQGFGSSGR